MNDILDQYYQKGGNYLIPSQIVNDIIGKIEEQDEEIRACEIANIILDNEQTELIEALKKIEVKLISCGEMMPAELQQELLKIIDEAIYGVENDNKRNIIE